MPIMRRPATVRKAGPYKCESLANGQILVTPTWPQFPPYTDEEGGGPGVFSRMALAGELARWLNAAKGE